MPLSTLDTPDGDDSPNEQRYRAPALEKGLEILELLSGEAKPLSFAGIAERLSRSKSELFRMLQVLEFRGYIARDEIGEGYTVTNKLFMLGMVQPRQRLLTEIATPHMRQMAETIEQSCHLVVPSDNEIVVILRVEAAGELGFSVRVGYRRHLIETTSGLIIWTFQPPAVAAQWLEKLKVGASQEAVQAFLDKSELVRREQHARIESDFAAGIVDLSAPLMKGDRAVAALTIPYVRRRPIRHSMDEAVEMLRGAAAAISEELTYSGTL